ncbi:MAG: hypothetical protein JWM82_1883 [Myxococcales bacterium]|nr:hypothetical protein [Myxococcales bacterium]
MATGLVGKAKGPVVGGLFLAFPAVFPVGLVMIERLENRAAGPSSRGHRARRAAVADAVGASLGAIGLAAFAIVAWRTSVHLPVAVALTGAVVAWATIAFVAWCLRRLVVNQPAFVARRAGSEVLKPSRPGPKAQA